MTGDSLDILSRVKRLIPNRWFSFVAPYRDALMGGLSDGAAWSYSLISYARLQTRIATSTGIFLDLIAFDFLGRYLLRSGANDAVFRAQIKATILQERVTRQGMINALTTVTGSPPAIFEPWNTGDTGAYGVPTFAYGAAGGWGSMNLPGQVFVKARHAIGPLTPNVGGFGNYPGGYGGGSVEYINPDQEAGVVDEAQILATILATKPTGAIVWTQIL